MNFQQTKQQIGVGNLMACGARDFIGSTADKSLSFRVGSKPGVREHIVVVLAPDDTYTVRYLKIRAAKILLKEEKTGVYCDVLGQVVRKMGDRA